MSEPINLDNVKDNPSLLLVILSEAYIHNTKQVLLTPDNNPNYYNCKFLEDEGWVESAPPTKDSVTKVFKELKKLLGFNQEISGEELNGNISVRYGNKEYQAEVYFRMNPEYQKEECTITTNKTLADKVV